MASRCRPRCLPRPRLADAAVCLLIGLAPATGQAADTPQTTQSPPTCTAPSQTLYLEVSVNQASHGLKPFIDAPGQLLASAAVLRELGFRITGDAPVALGQLTGVQVRYDARLQTLALDAPLEMLQLPTTSVGERATDVPHARASPGVLLNYDFYAAHADARSSAALTTELRVFGVGRGKFSNVALQRRFQQGTPRRWHSESLRLDTRWTLDFPGSALSLEIGDFVSGFLDWSRPVRMGGIQIGRNYALQPYRILTPTPRFVGQAVVPSNVELYVDGLRQFSEAVPAGPFQLATQPGINGTGTAQVVTTDAFGRTRTVDFDFYATQQLLARGLSDWSLALGRLRDAYGIDSFAYDDRTLGSGTWRYGVSDRLTAELHAEGGGGLRQAGIGGGWLPGRAGVFTAAYARSQLAGLRGSQRSFGYNWNNRRLNVNLLSRRTQGDYRDLGALQRSLPPSVSEQATVGISLDRFGTVSASYLRLQQPAGRDDRYASLYWSHTSARRWSTYLSLSQNLQDHDDRTAYLSVAVPLGHDRQVSLGVQHAGGAPLYTADVSQPVPGDGSGNGHGWRLQARHGRDGTGALAEAGWLTPVGRYSLGAVRDGGSRYGYANAGGALVWMGPHVFATRGVDDAFAVVSTGRFADVPVLLENRPIGVTGRNGLLLVSPLLSWQRNRLSIDTLHLPADVVAERVEDSVTPQQGAGLRVDFGLRRTQAVQLRVVDGYGVPLPAGSLARFARNGAAMVGHDGMLYLEDPPADGWVQVATPSGTCRLRLAPPPPAAGPRPPLRETLACVPDERAGPP